MKEQRVERILKALEEQGLSQMLIVDPLSIYYLTGYANDPYERFFGLLLRKDGQHVLFLNKLFYAPENSGVKEVWFSDTDPVAEVVAPYLRQGAHGALPASAHGEKGGGRLCEQLARGR